ncbi:MAG: ferredoxin [Chloroflexi bacterium HGW-Chloroflexi-2]|jgi:NAD-dependent dihydropyrimidine dehydrogenase PreA subunit|nr:MAG: ferredoxin [Chloroflexi bacterium HGW-Chloroflexi-2]
MAHVIIADECLMCGACEPECSDNAISECNGYYVIDTELCQDCGSCVDVCPNEAIRPA